MDRVCLFADVYGFSSRIIQDDLQALSKELESLHLRIEEIISRRDSLNLDLIQFSDTFFLTADLTQSPNGQLEDFLHVCCEIYESSFESDLPLRGAITFGEVLPLRNALLGAPVIQGAHIEKDLNIPLIVMPTFTLRELEKNFGADVGNRFAKPRQLEFQNGFMSVIPILPWDSTFIKEYANSKYEKLSETYNKSKPAGAWKKLIDILEADADEKK